MSKKVTTAKKKKAVEEDSELMEMALDKLTVEGTILKAKTVSNFAA